MSDPAANAPRIVVGVDGSEPSTDALRWAVRQAELTGDALEAVIAWDFPHNWSGWPPPGEPSFDWEAGARSLLTDTMDETVGLDRPVEIQARAVRGNAARVLLDQSSGAAFPLVVGNRGHGGFSEAMLGSVGQHCTHHATCPVVVVRGPQHTEGPGSALTPGSRDSRDHPRAAGICRRVYEDTSPKDGRRVLVDRI